MRQSGRQSDRNPDGEGPPRNSSIGLDYQLRYRAARLASSTSVVLPPAPASEGSNRDVIRPETGVASLERTSSQRPCAREVTSRR